MTIEADYTTVLELEIDRTGDTSTGTVFVETDGIKDPRIWDCTIIGGQNGIVMRGANGFQILRNTVKESAINGIDVEGVAGYTTQSQDGIVSENTVECVNGVPDNDGITLHLGGTTDLGDNFTVSKNTIDGDCGEEAIDITAGTDIRVFENLIIDGGRSSGIIVAQGVTDVTVSHNMLRVESVASYPFKAAYRIDGDTGDVDVYNNIAIRDESESDDDEACLQAGDGTGNPVDEVRIYNNTCIYRDDRGNSGVVGITVGADFDEDTTVKNNLVVWKDDLTSAGALTNWQGGSSTPCEGCVDYNAYWSPSSNQRFNADGECYDLNEWQGTATDKDSQGEPVNNLDPPADVNGFHADPLLSDIDGNTGADLTPTCGATCSPLIDAGDDSLCPSDDFARNLRSDGDCDIGALEY